MKFKQWLIQEAALSQSEVKKVAQAMGYLAMNVAPMYRDKIGTQAGGWINKVSQMVQDFLPKLDQITDPEQLRRNLIFLAQGLMWAHETVEKFLAQGNIDPDAIATLKWAKPIFQKWKAAGLSPQPLF